MHAILPTTYALIYTFLTKHDHIKAAKALKKATKDLVVLEDGLLSDGPLLDQIVKEWKDFKSASSKATLDSSSEESSSSSDSDSAEEETEPPTGAKSKTSIPSHIFAESSDSDSSSESDDETSDAESDKLQKPDAKKRPAEYESSRTLTSEGDSSSDDDDDDDSESKKVPEKELAKGRDVEESTSEESSSDDDSESEKVPEKELAKGHDDEESTSEESSSDSSSEEEVKAPVNQTKKAKATEDVDEERSVKKRKTSEDGEPLKQPIPTGGRNSNGPFRRVDLAKISSNIVDNRYENKAGPANDYGHRAHKDLISTRGAGFRKEKNKKKRGSYRGGEITMESHSYKFT